MSFMLRSIISRGGSRRPNATTTDSQEGAPLQTEVPLAGGSNSNNIPTGKWRDSMWNVCAYGPCHASALMSCCCVSIASAQLIRRLQLDFWGRPTKQPSVTLQGFWKLVKISCAFWLSRIFFLMLIGMADPNVKSKEWVEPPFIYHLLVALDDLLFFGYIGFCVLVLRNVRAQVRARYSIRSAEYMPCQCCVPFEDTICAACCPCLVAAQMLRHTADYEAYGGRCCSTTGLTGRAPSIV